MKYWTHHFFIKDGLIYWCDNGDVKEDDIHNYKGTVICSNKVRWRNASELIGKRDFYKSANEITDSNLKATKFFAPLLFLLTYKIIKKIFVLYPIKNIL